MNGVANGDVASKLMEGGFNVNCLRPYIGKNGKSYITTINAAGKLVSTQVANATATLRKDDWKILDDAIVKAAMPRLKAVADVRGAGLTYTIPNGMGKTVLETETQGDANDATVSMDGLREGADDRPTFEINNLPLPIIHKDFSFSARQLQTSRNGGSPLDTTMAESAGRKVAEMAEKILIGESTGTTYGGGTVYGYTNFPDRSIRTVTAPTASGWTGATFLADLLAMREQAKTDYHYGPYMVYLSSAWDQYIDDDYKAASDKTIRTRAKEIDGITDIRTLDYLSDTQIIMVQMTSDVVREVIGMDFTTLQWETNGGMKVNFKVMAIMVPQIRSDQNDRCGIVHGSV